MDTQTLMDLEAKLLTLGKNYGAWKAQSNHLERMRKVVLSKIMIEHLGCPVNERDFRSRQDERYIKHLDGQKVAEEKANQYWAELETVRETIANRRTMEASRREEMKLT